jgi:hypothetical protein
MRQAGDDEVRIIGGCRRHQERATLKDFVAGQSDEHGMLDVVVEGIAIADAFEREPGGKRNELGQAHMRRAEAILHIGSQERPQGFSR